MDSIEIVDSMLKQLETTNGITFASTCVRTFEPLWTLLADQENAGLFVSVATDKLDPSKTISKSELTEYLDQIRSLPALSNVYAKMPRECFLMKAGTVLFRALNARIRDGAQSLCLLSDSCIHLAAELDQVLEHNTATTKTRSVRTAPTPSHLEQTEIERQLRVLTNLTKSKSADESDFERERNAIGDIALKILEVDGVG